jgi:nitric oxide synthase oxygenase domain/subunit
MHVADKEVCITYSEITHSQTDITSDLAGILVIRVQKATYSKYSRVFFNKTRMLPTESLNVSIIFHFSDARLSILDSTAQWSLYVPPMVTVSTANGHCMYHQWSLYVPPVVTVCTASGHSMYRQWSLDVPPVVTRCTASGHCMYHKWSL